MGAGKEHLFRHWRKWIHPLVATPSALIAVFLLLGDGWRSRWLESATPSSSGMLMELPNTRYSHTASVEWYNRPTLQIKMAGEEDKRVTVYRNDFPGSTIGFHNFWDLASSGGWEKDTFKVLRFFLEGRPTECYVDFGAWIGPTALYAAHYSHHVYAIEPDPMAYSALVANVQKNSQLAQRIKPYFECINGQEGPVTLRGRGDSGSRANHPAGEGVLEWTIRCRTLKQFLVEEGAGTPRLIKIDVEGGELALLPSLQPLLRSFHGRKPAIWLSVHQPFWDKTDPALSDKMQEFWDTMRMYRYVYTDNTFSLVDTGSPIPDICVSFCEYLLTDEEFTPRF